MDVVHLGTHDAGNGAAEASNRLHRGLRMQGINSTMFVRTKETLDEHVYEFTPPVRLWDRLRRRVREERIQRAFRLYKNSRPPRAELFYDDRTRHKGDVLPQCPDADVLNLHSIYGFVDHSSFFRGVSKPVVWTLHDVHPFTGGCQYNVGCERFLDSCGNCPQLGSKQERDLSRQVWSRKRRAYQNVIEAGRLQLVAPSQWMAKEARRSTLFSEVPVEIIPNGIDCASFYPRDTEGVASALGIPSDHKIVLFLASSTERVRKGFDFLKEAADTVEDNDVSFVSVGGGDPQLADHVSHVHLGRVDSEILLSVFYSLADLFVIPSRQDNLPNTVLESMACGTPVVGFEVGGIPDMVRPNETGWLVEKGDVRGLRQVIERALTEDSERRRKGKTCRHVAEVEYALDVQADAYRGVYDDMLRGQFEE